jgi:hypothetical protein
MPGRQEGLGLFRGHPLIRAMLVTQSHARCTGDRAAIIYTNDFILGERVTAIEMRRPEDEFDVHVQTQLFEGFPPQRRNIFGAIAHTQSEAGRVVAPEVTTDDDWCSPKWGNRVPVRYMRKSLKELQSSSACAAENRRYATIS